MTDEAYLKFAEVQRLHRKDRINSLSDDIDSVLARLQGETIMRRRFEPNLKVETPIPYSPDDVDFKSVTVAAQSPIAVVIGTQETRAQAIACNHVGGAKTYSFEVGDKVIKVKVWE